MIDADDRVTCQQCRHLRNGWCQRAQQAGLSRRSPTAQVGSDLAALLQRCSAFAGRQATTLAGMSRSQRQEPASGLPGPSAIDREASKDDGRRLLQT